MKEIELGKTYQLKNADGIYDQKITFQQKNCPGTTPIEVLNTLIEKLYADQFTSFSCELATAIEFFKAGRRVMMRNLSKKSKDE